MISLRIGVGLGWSSIVGAIRAEGLPGDLSFAILWMGAARQSSLGDAVGKFSFVFL